MCPSCIVPGVTGLPHSIHTFLGTERDTRLFFFLKVILPPILLDPFKALVLHVQPLKDCLPHSLAERKHLG